MPDVIASPVVATEPGLAGFFRQVRRFPILSEELERKYAVRWRSRRDPRARDALVGSHLRLVVKIAKGYRGYGLPVADIISEGNIGLMRAIDRFEPERGFRLATYAAWWIRASIQEYIMRSCSLVRLGTTAEHKKLFFNLRKIKNRISALDDGDLRPEQVDFIAKRLGVSKTNVIDMNRRLNGGEFSLNASRGNSDGGDDSGDWQDWLVDDAPSQEHVLADAEELDIRRKALIDALSVLNERERRIFEARRLVDDPVTLEDLADMFGISRERVRQIGERALEKVERAVKDHVAAIASRPVTVAWRERHRRGSHSAEEGVART